MSSIDASSAQIVKHLQQLKPVLATNADVIPYMRAGFIGAYGEWWGSASDNSCGWMSGSTPCDVANANRATVRDALIANVPSTTQIGFRYPADLMRWYPNATQQTRVGMHDDCFLAGPSDTGTYPDAASRDYAKALTVGAAFGGETCDNGEAPARTDCADILSEGAQYHLAWLNVNYAPSYIGAWKSGGCYDEVSRSMGYRIQLDAVSHVSQVSRGGTATISVEMRDVGWARMFVARSLVVTLRHRNSGALITGAGGDLGSLAPQATSSTTLPVQVVIPAGADVGDYDVYLSAPDIFPSTVDKPDFSVRFANADDEGRGQMWSAAEARFKLGTTLTVN
jgi:hypothetical protein